MERQLSIIRHGKSSWDHEGLEDRDRPLSERGIRNAATMAKRVAERGQVPEWIFSSPASRALNTALIMARIWELGPAALQIHDPLYMAYLREIAGVVGSAPKEVKRLAVFGHNPSFTQFANVFLEDRLENLPTAGVVTVTLRADDWKGIERAEVIRTHVDYPKKGKG